MNMLQKCSSKIMKTFLYSFYTPTINYRCSINSVMVSTKLKHHFTKRHDASFSLKTKDCFKHKGSHKRDVPQKRQLGRYPRIPFTSEQLTILEEKFQQSPYLSSEEAIELSNKLQLADVKVKIWFQNRRARKRREEIGDIQKKKHENEKKTSESKQLDSMTVPESMPGSSLGNINTISLPFIYIPSQNLLDFNR